MADGIRSTAILLLLSVLVGCEPPSATDLEILDVTADAAALGDDATLTVQVKNNGGDPVTVSAATTGDTDMGLIRKGPAVEIRRNRTESLTLQVPVARPYLDGCDLRALVFLARPGEPPNLARDMWTDPVPENHSREFRSPIDRPAPTELEVDEPIREVVESSNQTLLRRHYEGTARVLPEGSLWAVRRYVMQTQTATGTPIELLGATLTGDRLRSGAVIWTLDAARRDSVARATVRLNYEDCEGVERFVDAERIAVTLAPR
jgi:hypothetical protein